MAILHLMRESGTSVDDAEELLNKQSGWKALTGTTSFGDIISSNEEDKKLAYDIFVDRIWNLIGAYYLKLDGSVDALVFAGGIGERSTQLRERVSRKCACLGFELDEGKNNLQDLEELNKTVRSIGIGGKQILVCQTDEQFEMAHQCMGDTNLYSK